jgi:hypothetical protein
MPIVPIEDRDYPEILLNHPIVEREPDWPNQVDHIDVVRLEIL